MAIGTDTGLLENLQHAIKKAGLTGTAVLVSSIKKVKDSSPLAFYHSGHNKYLGERLFWHSPSENLTIAGIGKAGKLQVQAGPERYNNIEKEWNTLLANSIIHKKVEVPATGPILFGGFSFDKENSESLLWDQFGDHLFYIPRYMMTQIGRDTYITVNLLCTPDENFSDLLSIMDEGERLLSGMAMPKEMKGSRGIKEITEKGPEQWKRTVQRAVDTMKESCIDKIVLARELRVQFEDSILPDPVLERLLKEQPTSYVFSFESGSDAFVGASPERLVKKEKNKVFSTCLAGSIGRGNTPEEDEKLGNSLLHDPKNLIEHQYVVGMIREAVESVCRSVSIPSRPVLMKTRHIQHLYTPVTGEMDEVTSIFHLVEKLHPTPALGGLPRREALEWIHDNENMERGFYAAPIGWTDADGNGEFAVGIRSALLQGNEASLFAGCGIVEDSCPEDEYEETWIKFKPMLQALGGTKQ